MATVASTPPARGADGDSGRDRSGERAALLERVDLFSGLSRIVLAKIAASLDPVEFTDHEAACVQGDPGDSMYIVSRGALGVFLSPDGKTETRVATLGPGACFGEMALLTGEPRSATVRAVGASEAFRLEREGFIDVLRREPGIGLAMSATLSRRLREADQTMTQDKTAIVNAVSLQLEALDGDSRELALRASVLEYVTLPALRAVFGADAERVAGALGTVGIDAAAGLFPLPILRALRALLERERGLEAKLAQIAEAARLLAAAGCWEDALALYQRFGPRQALLETLQRAARSSNPPELTHWAARLDPEEAATVGLAHPAAGAADAPAPAAGQASGVWRRVRARPSTALTVLATLGFTAAAAVTGHASPRLAFLLLLAAAVSLWVTALLPDFLVCAGLVVGWILFGVASPAQALAGFGTGSWMTAFAILGLAAAISSSGLLFRFGLLLVRRMPSGLFGQAATFLCTGILLTPLLPSSTARSGLAVPLALTAAQAQRLKERGPESAVLGMAAYIGANPLLFLFLNGSTSCLLALGLLPEAARARVDFSFWFLAALPLAVLICLGTLAMLWIVLRPGRVHGASRAQLNLQLSILGRPAPREIAMTAILLLTVLGWNVGPALGVPSSVIGLLSLLAAAIAGCFTRASLQSLNWDFLIAYGVILSISGISSALGIDATVAAMLRAALGEGNVPAVLFVLLVAVLCLVVRIFLPQDQALLLLALALLPAAPVVGVDPWIVIIVLLATFSTWFFPTQTAGYLMAYDASEERLYTHRQAQRVCLGFTVVVLLSLALTVPYWQVIGLL